MSFFSIPGVKPREVKKERVTVKYTPSKPIEKAARWGVTSIARSGTGANVPDSPRSSTTPTPESNSPRKHSHASATRGDERESKARRTREREAPAEATRASTKRRKRTQTSETDSESDDKGDGLRSSAKHSRRNSPVWAESEVSRRPLAERDLFDTDGTSTDGEKHWGGFVHSANIVKHSDTKYTHYFEQDGFGAVDLPEVQLSYPRSGCRERFSLLAPKTAGEYFPINDLLRTIQLMVWIYVPTTASPLFGLHSPDTSTTATDEEEITASGQDTILRALHKAFNRKDGPAFVSAVDSFNIAFEKVVEAKELKPRVDEASWVSLVTAIGEQVYQRQVGPVTASLADYEPFSDNVYGELLPRFMTEILTRFPMNADTLFLDLGSGVSNLTVQASLQAGCQSLGCEQMPNPARMAVKQIEEAKRRWSMWCLKGNEECRAVEGDFCANDEVRLALPKADLILVNNYAFTPALNDRLSLLFLDLKDGARIISLKPFLQKDFRLTERTATSPLAILKMRQLSYPSNSVSWTENGGVYYECVIDRTAIREFFEKGIRRSR